MTPSTPSIAHRGASARSSSVRTSVSVARIAAVDSALPASVPPTPPTSTSSSGMPRPSARQLLGERIGARRDPAADRLADREDVRLQAVGRRVAARAGADGVGLVDDQQRAVPRVSSRQRRGSQGREARCRRWSGRLEQHDGDVAVGELAVEASMSLISTTSVVSAGAPARRGCRGGDDAALSVQANVSSTEPW